MGKKIPATGTWEGGTEYPGRRPVPGDEVYGRKQGEALGDMEFGQAVAPYLDPEDKGLIDPSRAKLVGLKAPAWTSAMNVPPGDEAYKRKIDPSIHPEGKRELVLAPGNIYAMHARDAQPTTWAHEFRHDSEKLNGMWNEEAYNRYEDLHHALTESDEQDAHEFLRDLMVRRVMNNRDDERFADIRTVGDLDVILNAVKPALRQEMQSWHDNGREGYAKHLSAFMDEYLEAQGPPDEHKKPMDEGNE